MTQGKGDGTNPKFRILCQRCKSYMHTAILRDDASGFCIVCKKCGNQAADFKDQFDE